MTEKLTSKRILLILHPWYELIPMNQQDIYAGNSVHECQNDDIPVTDPGVLKIDDYVRRSVQCSR